MFGGIQRHQARKRITHILQFPGPGQLSATRSSTCQLWAREAREWYDRNTRRNQQVSD